MSCPSPSRFRGTTRLRVDPVTSFAAAIAYLDHHINLERLRNLRAGADTFRLDRMYEICRLLGHPEKSLNCVHVAGTKGKGSTVGMLAGALTAAGLTVGSYTSPHLIELTERIRIDGIPIGRADFTTCVREVARAARGLKKDRLHFFEILTAAAFVHFAEKAVDIAIIEVGLGGRLDATNVIVPQVAVVTPISFDHMELLGDTLTLIAREKAGIFKSGVPAICAEQPPEAERSLRNHARRVGCRISVVGREISYQIDETQLRGQKGVQRRVQIEVEGRAWGPVGPAMSGIHQAANAATTLAALDALRESGLRFSRRRAEEGIERTRVAGRLQVLAENPVMIVDGAHNAASVDAVVRTLQEQYPSRSLTLVFGCAADKDVRGMLPLLAAAADHVIFTRAANTRRSLAPGDLRNAWKSLCESPCQVDQTLGGAINRAKQLSGVDGVICILGSFYLAGEAMELAQTAVPIVAGRVTTRRGPARNL